MSDLISRADAIDAIREECWECNNMFNDDLYMKILALPSADRPSIVRCKDCIHYEKHDTWSACTYWSGNPYEQASVIDDDFCSYGERAEQTEYKLPGHDEVMDALDKLTLRGGKDV